MKYILDIWLTILFCVAFAVGRQAHGNENDAKPHISIDARLDGDLKTLSGVLKIQIFNHTRQALSSIPISLYPNRFNKINPNLDDRMVRWLYPAGESKGGMKIKDLVWNGVPIKGVLHPIEPGDHLSDGTLAILRLPKILEPNETGELYLSFSVKIPERRGRFGRWRGVVTLGGGWFPRPLADLTGKDASLPFDAIDTEVRLTIPKGMGAVLNNRIFPKNEQPQTIEAKDLDVDELALVVMDKMEIDEQAYDWGRAVHVHQELRNKKASWKDTRSSDGSESAGGLPAGLKDLGDVDISGRIFDVVGNTAQLIQDLGLGAMIKKELILVDVPTWDRMVQLGPGPILVSDRIWRIFPLEAALWFHDLALARAVAGELLSKEIRKREKASERYITMDLVGAFIAEQYGEKIHKKNESVEDIIGFASFLPTIDNLIYAPQLPFSEIYSKSVEEPDILRDEPWRFMNQAPRGKRILGKLEDYLSRASARELILDFLKSDIPFSAVLGTKLGDFIKVFHDQWYGAYPQVNYRLKKVEDIPIQDKGYLHRAEVARDGDSIKEPVTVRIIDANGVTKDLVWDGKGSAGEVEWISKAPTKSVQIDPLGRLVESLELTDGHPLADNFESLPWRPPMLSRILISGDATTGDPYIQLGLIMRRRYDITNAFLINGSYTPRSLGGNLGYLRYFGPKRTLNSRTWYFGPLMGVTRYREVSGEGLSLPDSALFAATAGFIKLVIGRDDRYYFFDPRSGSGLGLEATYSLGADDRGKAVQAGDVQADYVALFSPSICNTFALHVGAMGVFGQPSAAQLATLSVREILKGFDIDETYGRIALYTVAEHRFTIVDAAHIKGPLFSWFDRFQGVLSFGGGTISKPTGYSGLFTKNHLYSEAGAGLRIHLLVGGVQQYIIAFDIAFPLTPRDRDYEIESQDGATSLRQRDPFKIKLGIMQTF